MSVYFKLSLSVYHLIIYSELFLVALHFSFPYVANVFVPHFLAYLPGFFHSFLPCAGGLCFHRVAKLSRAYCWVSSEEPLLGHFQVTVGLHLKVDQ